ncbi:hypothetical protein Taro_012979, partial [Colocasia esculenta]|nr:hypothetical protein [Colocasia esculenta]
MRGAKMFPPTFSISFPHLESVNFPLLRFAPLRTLLRSSFSPFLRSPWTPIALETPTAPFADRLGDAHHTLRRPSFSLSCDCLGCRRPWTIALETPIAPFADRLGRRPHPSPPILFPVLRLPRTLKVLDAEVVAVGDLEDLKILEDGDHHPALKVRKDVLWLAGKLGEIRASAFHV